MAPHSPFPGEFGIRGEGLGVSKRWPEGKALKEFQEGPVCLSVPPRSFAGSVSCPSLTAFLKANRSKAKFT